MSVSIQSLVDKALKEKQDNRKPRSDAWSPSSFGQCFRKQYWSRMNEIQTNPPDQRSLRVFACGNLFHNFVQNVLPPHEVEVSCKKDDISGRADVVLPDEVIDLKSIHSKGFFYLKETNIKEEKKNNWLQTATYAWILGKEKIRLVFISKDDLCINEYFDYTKNWVDKIDEELKPLREYWAKKELPPAIPRAYGKDEKTRIKNECGSYCSFRDKCFAMEKEKK